MRWVVFAIVLALFTVFQTSVAPFLAMHSVRPDFMLIFAVFIALMARSQDALIACWGVGLAMDLMSLSYGDAANVGLHAFCLGLIGAGIVGIRSYLFRDSVVTQVVFTITAKLILDLLAGAYMLYRLDAWHRFGEVTLLALWAAAYTAVVAPYVHWLLRRLRTALGVGMPHRVRVR